MYGPMKPVTKIWQFLSLRRYGALVATSTFKTLIVIFLQLQQYDEAKTKQKSIQNLANGSVLRHEWSNLGHNSNKNVQQAFQTTQIFINEQEHYQYWLIFKYEQKLPWLDRVQIQPLIIFPRWGNQFSNKSGTVTGQLNQVLPTTKITLPLQLPVVSLSFSRKHN